MQLSVDQKIQAAIKPLIERISALEQENTKFKQEILALQSPQPKLTNHKPAPKPPVQQLEKPQAVKGPRKKSTDVHEVKHDNKTNQKNVQKKQEIKGEGQQSKHDQPKVVVPKTPGVVAKGVNSPIGNKDIKQPVTSSNKDIKNRPSTAANGVKANNSSNKTNANDKKTVVKTLQAQKKEQKAQGEQKTQEKKQTEGHQKVQKPTNNIKTPVVNKTKQPSIHAIKVDPKKVATNAPEVGKNVKKGGKQVQPKKQQQKKQVKNEQAVPEKSEQNLLGQNTQVPAQVPAQVLAQVQAQEKVQTVAQAAISPQNTGQAKTEQQAKVATQSEKGAEQPTNTQEQTL